MHFSTRAWQAKIAMIIFSLLFAIPLLLSTASIAYADPQDNSRKAANSIEKSSATGETTTDEATASGAAVETDETKSDTAETTTINPFEVVEKAHLGKWSKLAGNKWKFVTAEGPLVGFQRVSGKIYYFNSDGIMETGWLSQQNDWYYFERSGAMKTGWVKLSGKWYYLDPTNGKMLTGKHTIKGATYYLTSSGAMKVGWNKEEETWYYYNRSGALVKGWIKDKVWYYLDPAQDGAMQTGKYKVGNAWYISNGSGAMYANKWVKLPEGWYWATSSGALKTGWLKTGGKWYWLQGDKDGMMLANTAKHIDGVYYAFKADGAMYANSRVKFEDGTCGYAVSSGAITKIGVYDGDKVILKDTEGNILTGWQKLAGKWFYANNEGILQTGWISDGGKRYFLDSQGVYIPNYAASQKLIAAAQRVPFQGNARCAQWTNAVYTAAGYAHPDGNACDLYRKYCNISDLSQLQPGMIIAVPSHTRSAMGGKYGHAALYMGNGMVRHNTNKLETIPLSQWLAYYETTYKAKCGWAFR